MTTVRLLKNGIEAFPVMFDAIERAERSINVEMFIYANDRTGNELLDRLVSAARRRVVVKVMIDAVGSWSLPEDYWTRLTDAGGVVRRFRPVTFGMFLLRDHRKLVLVDDQIVYVGGMNVADEYFRGKGIEPAWRDNMLEIAGPEAVRVRISFDRMWGRAETPLRKAVFRAVRRHSPSVLEDGRIRFLESGPEYTTQQVRRAYRMVINSSRGRIDLAMGYFYPHGGILRALKHAVLRGVRVRLLFPQHSDVALARWAARGLYGRLLRAGMEVWEYRPSMLHAKLAIIDDIVIAGSANLDIRSDRINAELVAVVTDPDLASRARTDFEQDLKQAEQIQLQEWKARPRCQQIKERISYLLLARADVFFARAEMARMIR